MPVALQRSRALLGLLFLLMFSHWTTVGSVPSQTMVQFKTAMTVPNPSRTGGVITGFNNSDSVVAWSIMPVLPYYITVSTWALFSLTPGPTVNNLPPGDGSIQTVASNGTYSYFITASDVLLVNTTSVSQANTLLQAPINPAASLVVANQTTSMLIIFDAASVKLAMFDVTNWSISSGAVTYLGYAVGGTSVGGGVSPPAPIPTAQCTPVGTLSLNTTYGYVFYNCMLTGSPYALMARVVLSSSSSVPVIETVALYKQFLFSPYAPAAVYASSAIYFALYDAYQNARTHTSAIVVGIPALFMCKVCHPRHTF